MGGTVVKAMPQLLYSRARAPVVIE